MQNRAYFNDWHGLRKTTTVMKPRFTYKEFTVLAGILVAVIIMLTLWLQPFSGESGEVSRKLIPSAGKPAASVIVEKVLVTLETISTY